jgi:hypothetical protein
MTLVATPARDGARHPSPPLVALAGVHAALFLASLVVTAVLTRGAHFPSPFDSGAALAFFGRYPTAVRWGAFLQLGAAVPLGLFAATVTSRLHFLGVRAAGATIALFGGLGAAVLLALSAAFQWALSSPEVVTSPAAVRGLHLVAFATSGPGLVMLLGLLLAGVAVTGGLSGLLPRWMLISGLVLAGLAELSWFALVLPAASVLLPLARFPGLAWLVVAGALLPERRKGAEARPARGELPGGMATRRPAGQTP